MFRLLQSLLSRPAPPVRVVDLAEAALRRHLPPGAGVNRGERRLEVHHGGRTHVWDVGLLIDGTAQLPAHEWPGLVDAMAQKLVRALLTAFQADALRPVMSSCETAEELRATGNVVVPLAPGLEVALVAAGRDVGVRAVETSDLERLGLSPDEACARATANLRLSVDALGLAPLGDGAPVLTNHAAHPFAAALLADAELLAALRKAGGRNLLFAVPAPSRVFVAPDVRGSDAALARLLVAARTVEGDLLSPFVYRFDGERLSLATAQH